MDLFLDQQQQHWKCVEIQILEAYPMSKNSESETVWKSHKCSIQTATWDSWHSQATVNRLTMSLFRPFFFPGDSEVKSICLECWRPGFNPWVGKIPWRRKWQPTPVLLPGESHGGRSLVGYSPWGRKESDMTEQLHSLTQWYLQSWLTDGPPKMSTI